MADSSARDAEAVVDEVTLLEAALREAMQKRHHLGAAPEMPSPGGLEMPREIFREQLRYPLDVNAAALSGRRDIDVATAAYGAQLKAWIDMAVDSRLNVVLPSVIEGELISSQQETAAAARLYQTLQNEVELVKGAQAKLLNLVEGLSEEFGRMKLQGEALAAVEKVMYTVEELKQSVSVGERSLDPLHLERLSSHDTALSEMLGRHDRHEARFTELDEVMADLRRLHSDSHTGVHQELAELRRLHDAVHGRYSELHGTVGNLRSLHDELRSQSSGLRDSQSVQLTELQRALDEMRGLHHGLAEKHHTSLADFHQLHGEARARHEREIAEATGAMSTTKQEVAELVAVVHQLDKRLAAWRSEIISEVAEEIRAMDTAQQTTALKNRELQSLSGDLEARVESICNTVVNAAKQEDLIELRFAFEEAQKSLSGEMLKHQQRLVSDLRAETSTAFRSEAAAVAALDEQLWLTDQRLGQRIDELAHSHRECITVVERRIGNVLHSRLHTPAARELGDHHLKERIEVELHSSGRPESNAGRTVSSFREDLQRELGKSRVSHRSGGATSTRSSSAQVLEEVSVRVGANGVVTDEVLVTEEEVPTKASSDAGGGAEAANGEEALAEEAREPLVHSFATGRLFRHRVGSGMR
mmetsp:Transcript_76174/g.134854  ORF Transcript_76174/g.134854 Transcript_76174/m.134854 type:complete len:644 (-) Transcript_76174:111-2042(-)